MFSGVFVCTQRGLCMISLPVWLVGGLCPKGLCLGGVMTCDQHIVVTCTQRYCMEQCSHVIAIFMLNKCHLITLELCVKYYYMVAASVSDVDHWWMQFLEVDVTGPWRFLCSKDRFDWGMASHACASLWVLEFYIPTVYWSTYPQETDKHTSP